MSARDDFPALASVADTGLAVAGLRRQCIRALLEVDDLRRRLTEAASGTAAARELGQLRAELERCEQSNERFRKLGTEAVRELARYSATRRRREGLQRARLAELSIGDER